MSSADAMPDVPDIEVVQNGSLSGLIPVSNRHFWDSQSFVVSYALLKQRPNHGY
jgi:hypothetical protein